MARDAEVKRRGRLSLLALLLIGAAGGAFRTAAQQGTADILLVERPGHLVLLDRYQQSMQADERRRIAPFTPLVILDAHVRLGDGLTPARRVSIDGTVAYLVEDGGGGLSGASRAGVIRVMTGDLLRRDTVEILQGGAVRCVSPLHDHPTILTRGDRMVRYFTRDALTYVRRLGGGSTFGWVNLAVVGEGRVWRSAGTRAAAAAPGQASSVEDVVRARLGRANDVLRSLFETFNRETGESRSTPTWTVQRDGERLLCSLEGHAMAADFAESSVLLARDLETALLGGGMRVTPAPGRIEIRPEAHAPTDR
jgi:hypothetical protein